MFKMPLPSTFVKVGNQAKDPEINERLRVTHTETHTNTNTTHAHTNTQNSFLKYH